VLQTFPPVWTTVARLSGDHIPLGGFAAANGTRRFAMGSAKPPSKTGIESRDKPPARDVFSGLIWSG
jgi:hypothetical protein